MIYTIESRRRQVFDFHLKNYFIEYSAQLHSTDLYTFKSKPLIFQQIVKKR